MENFNHIHVHSVYSQYDAVQTPAQIIEQAVKHGHRACALTDHGAMGGLLQFQREAIKNGVKPLLGMEGYVVDKLVNEDDKGKRVRMKNNHIILLAKNKEGWNNLCKLNYISNADEKHYYYKPRFNFEELWEHKEGLVVSSACLASPFSNLLKLGKDKEAEELFEKFCCEFGEDFFAEVQLNEVPDQIKYNDWLIGQATHMGVPIIIAGDCHYSTPSDYEIQKLAFQIRKGEMNEIGQDYSCKSLFYQGINDFKTFSKIWRYNYSDSQIESWCANTNYIVDKVNYTIPGRIRMILPRQCFDEETELINRSKEGLSKHFNCDYKDCPKEYRDRLEFELNLMIKKGICRYLLCLSNIVKWCDDNHISHGIARGSAASSLVVVCIGITGWAIDPIKYNLIFSRFISEARLPTAMIDYAKEI